MIINCLSTGSSGNAYIISDGATNILIECGISYKKILQLHNYKKIDLCLISHEHKDHCKSVNDILRNGIDTYMSQGTRHFLQLEERHNLHTIKAQNTFAYQTFNILPFDVVHDVAEPLGFLVHSTLTNEKLVYITDTVYCKYKFSGVTHWMVEINFVKEQIDENAKINTNLGTLRNRIVKNHMSLDVAKDFFKANDLSKTQEIWLLHLSDNNSNEQKILEEIMQATGKYVIIP